MVTTQCCTDRCNRCSELFDRKCQPVAIPVSIASLPYEAINQSAIARKLGCPAPTHRPEEMGQYLKQSWRDH
jgi:hypothetical protein